MKYFIIALLALATPSFADELEDRRTAARDYIESEVQQKMMDDMLAPEALISQIQAMLPPEASSTLTEDQIDQMGRIASEELATFRPGMESAMVEAAAEIFTVAELEALIAFYATPEGTAVALKMQPFMAKFYSSIGEDMQIMQSRIVDRIAVMMQEN